MNDVPDLIGDGGGFDEELVGRIAKSLASPFQVDNRIDHRKAIKRLVSSSSKLNFRIIAILLLFIDPAARLRREWFNVKRPCRRHQEIRRTLTLDRY